MKKRTRAKSSGLFLLELIIAILFFTAASAVCIQFFVKSYTMSQDSSQLDSAVNECSTMAEIVQTSDSERDAMKVIEKTYPEAVTAGSEVTVFFDDDNMKVCADFSTSGGMMNCRISAEKVEYPESDSDSKIVIYELSVKHALQEVDE